MKLFQTRLERRKRQLVEHEVDEDWKKDLGEVATRIWEWWRPIVAEGNKEFPAFKNHCCNTFSSIIFPIKMLDIITTLWCPIFCYQIL
jgi:hypothetical protein